MSVLIERIGVGRLLLGGVHPENLRASARDDNAVLFVEASSPSRMRSATYQYFAKSPTFGGPPSVILLRLHRHIRRLKSLL